MDSAKLGRKRAVRASSALSKWARESSSCMYLLYFVLAISLVANGSFLLSGGGKCSPCRCDNGGEEGAVQKLESESVNADVDADIAAALTEAAEDEIAAKSLPRTATAASKNPSDATEAETDESPVDTVDPAAAAGIPIIVADPGAGTAKIGGTETSGVDSDDASEEEEESGLRRRDERGAREGETEQPQPLSTPPLNGTNMRFVVDTAPIQGPTYWECLSLDIQKAFTLNGKIPMDPMMYAADSPVPSTVQCDSPISLPPSKPREWKKGKTQHRIRTIRERIPYKGVYFGYGQKVDNLFYKALDAHPIKGKNVLVIGSETPWLECFCAAYGARIPIYSVDFTKPKNERPELFHVMTVDEMEGGEGLEQYDVIVAYSVMEHDGLGRYGTRISPNADLLRMKKLLRLINPNGLLFLGVPIGKDLVSFNAHRVYGMVRFPMLTKGWKILGTYGGDLERLKRTNSDWQQQPLLVLTPDAIESGEEEGNADTF